MIKAMIFIDGTWLYSNIPTLREEYGKEDFHVDFGKLPKVLTAEVSRQMNASEDIDPVRSRPPRAAAGSMSSQTSHGVDIVRTHLFGSYAANYDLQDEESVQRRRDFFSLLREEYHYELHLYAVNYLGRRLRKGDREADDDFEPKEKCVDLSLATTLLYQAAIPHAYDIAIVVIGDRDFMPVLQHARLLGKRVAIASIKKSCAAEYADTEDPARIKDFDIIWLDDLLPQLELKYEAHKQRCESPMHRGNPTVTTTFRPRKGQRFYCDECRKLFANQKHAAEQEFVSSTGRNEAFAQDPYEEYAAVKRRGVVTRVIPDRGFGFVQTDDGSSYFFHFTDLENMDFEKIQVGMKMEFEVKTLPRRGKAGAAQNLRVNPVTTA